MADNSNENIVSSLRTLIWGAFIGVVSFQVLAPEVWGYLDKALGIPHDISYWIFTWTYFLLIPLIVLGWIYEKRILIAYYLPDYKRALKQQSRWFLNGLILFIALQIVITITGFIIHWRPEIFYFVWGLYTLCCGLLLGACYLFCIKHINHRYKLQKSEAAYDHIASIDTIYLKAKKY